MAGTNELAKNIIGLYERHAVAWDKDRQESWADKAWHDRFIEALPKGGHVLDLGCGAGLPVAGHLKAHGFQIMGVDTSPTLIALSCRRMPDQEWIVADMRGLLLERRFDGILAWDSFFHLPPEDQRAMFEVFARHAASSALLMFTAGPAFGDAIGSYRGELLYHASLSPQEYESLLTRYGFTILDHVVEDPDAGKRTIWLARFTAKY